MSNSNKKPETLMVEHVRLGNALAVLGRKIGLTNDDCAAFDNARDKTPAEPMELLDVAAGYNIQPKRRCASASTFGVQRPLPH